MGLSTGKVEIDAERVKAYAGDHEGGDGHPGGRGAGGGGRPPAHFPPFGGELAAAGVVARIVAAAVRLLLEGVGAKGESPPQAPEAAKVRDSQRELEHDERMGPEIFLLAWRERLGVVPERPSVGGRVPCPVAMAVVQGTCTGVRHVAYASRAGIHEVPLEP